MEASESGTNEAQLEVDHATARTRNPAIFDDQHLFVTVFQSSSMSAWHVLLQYPNDDYRARRITMPLVTIREANGPFAGLRQQRRGAYAHAMI